MSAVEKVLDHMAVECGCRIESNIYRSHIRGYVFCDSGGEYPFFLH